VYADTYLILNRLPLIQIRYPWRGIGSGTAPGEVLVPALGVSSSGSMVSGATRAALQVVVEDMKELWAGKILRTRNEPEHHLSKGQMSHFDNLGRQNNRFPGGTDDLVLVWEIIIKISCGWGTGRRIPFRTSKVGPRRKRGTGTLAHAPVPAYEKNEGPKITVW